MTTTTAELTGKRQLHIELVDRQDKPCAKCGSKDRREIHRIIWGCFGGQYILSNVEVLCFHCHKKEHRQSKFEVDEQVWVNGRSPKSLLIDKSVPYKVLAVSYDGMRQCSIYTLDVPIEYEFRSYQLKALADRRQR